MKFYMFPKTVFPKKTPWVCFFLANRKTLPTTVAQVRQKKKSNTGRGRCLLPHDPGMIIIGSNACPFLRIHKWMREIKERILTHLIMYNIQEKVRAVVTCLSPPLNIL